MTNAEKQKVEKEKEILFDAWQKFNYPFAKNATVKELRGSFATINYTFLQLSCFAAKIDQEFLFDEKLSGALYDMRCMVDFFEQIDETLRTQKL